MLLYIAISVANKPEVGISTKGLKQCYASEMAAGPGNAETVLPWRVYYAPPSPRSFVPSQTTYLCKHKHIHPLRNTPVPTACAHQTILPGRSIIPRIIGTDQFAKIQA